MGIFSPPAPGHVNPMSCLGRALQARGHRLTYFQIPDFEEAVRKTGLDFAPYGERAFPKGFTTGLYAELGKRKGIAALRYIIQWFTNDAVVLMDEVPSALRDRGIEVLLVD